MSANKADEGTNKTGKVREAVRPADDPKSKSYGFLTIEHRLLVFGPTSIAIPNIARLSTTMTTMKLKHELTKWDRINYSAIALFFFLAFQVPSPQQSAWGRGPQTDVSTLAAVLFVFGFSALIVAFVRFTYRFHKHLKSYFLHVTTNDGGTFSFQAPLKATIDVVRQIISDKINEPDQAAVYNINFEQGTIENVSIGKVEQIGAVVSGSGNTVNAATGSARVGTTEAIMTATNSPGAQIGSGHTATGNTYAVDYASVLPEVVRIQQHYDRDPRTQDLARRLAELEFLMRSGTPTREGKEKLHSIVGDMSSALQAYPAMVQFFQHIARLAGF